MNFENENNAEERRKADAPAAGAARGGGQKGARKKTPKGGGRASPEVGQALRTIYQRTIDEDIPSEMLDLLGKLG